MKTDFNGQPIVQGAGHVIFTDGTKCTRYVDSDGKYYFTAELYDEEFMIKCHGKYIMN